MPGAATLAGRAQKGVSAGMRSVSAARETRIEEMILAKHPELQQAEESPILTQFTEKVLARLNLPRLSRQIFFEFSSPDVTAEKVGQCLTANPYYEYQFFHFIRSLKGGGGGQKDEEVEQPRIESAIVLLGMQRSRNFILALQAIRSIKGVHPDWGKDGNKLAYNPSDILKFAVKTEESLVANAQPGQKKGTHSDSAFAAGYVFDLIWLLAEALVQDATELKAVLKLIETTYAHSLRTAQLSVALGASLADFPHAKYLFSAALLHDMGKPILAILDRSYLKFTEDCDKKNLPRSVRHYAEQTRYGVNHSVLGAFAGSCIPIFRSAERAILFHHLPFLLRSAADKSIYTLSALIQMATLMANAPQKPTGEDDPVLTLWKGPELKDIPISAKQLIEVASKQPT